MQEKTAREIVETMLNCGKSLNHAAEIAKNDMPADELGEFNRVIGAIMGDILTNVLNPIFEKYPELIPEGLEYK